MFICQAGPLAFSSVLGDLNALLLDADFLNKSFWFCGCLVEVELGLVGEAKDWDTEISHFQFGHNPIIST